jgi:hypothetical protein
MSAVGIVTIALGVLVVCGRVTLLVAPVATLRWFKETNAPNGRLRTLGAFLVTLGAAMAWAGASEDSGLAVFLTIFGWGILGISALLLVLFPGVYRAIADPFLPSDTGGSLFLWRFRGLAGSLIGGLIIYFGALAL